MDPPESIEKEYNMRKALFLVFMVVVVGVSCRGVSMSEEVTAESLEEFDTAFRYFVVLEGTEKNPLRWLYACIGGHLHAWVVKDGRPQKDWETATLGSSVTSLFVEDVDANGTRDIMVSTARGRIIVYDANTYERTHENFLEPFESIECMTAANIDDDPQQELIFIADKRLNIYDAKSTAMMWRSQDEYTAAELLVANVDDDTQPEIILNTGHIIDSRFYTIEPSNVGSGAFGKRIRLLDLNGDGYPEVVGEMPGYVLKVYDVYAQREIW
jgi:hypothetical protein